MVYLLLRLLAAFAKTAEGLAGLFTLGLWLPDALAPAADRLWRKKRDQKRRRRAAEGRWA